MSAERALLVITDPAARSADGESVRVALDVLRAAAPAKIVVPSDAAELERALVRRGRRRVVLVGGDGGMHAVVRVLERHGELSGTPLGVVPVDTRPGASGGGHLARALGLPAEAAKAARVALGDRERCLDLLTDDLGGVALRSVRIGEGVRATRTAAPAGAVARRALRSIWDRAAHSMSAAVGPTGQRLRIEADGRVIVDVDRPVFAVHVGCDDCDSSAGSAAGGANGDGGMPPAAAQERLTTITPGTAAVSVTGSPGAGRFGLPAQTRGADETPTRRLHVRAREITVCGPDFTYEADTLTTGPVRLRTWTVRPAAWRLYVPEPPA
ncbi:hypothetical protein GCM10023205_11470 [Yinghuangia aomiensis]|uniref:DAGKc domain-containing protein n=1 Tax=Yinghuangia aomiensis TaxID=676205 RepID=A0ABP9GSR4_9ACTN